MGAPPSDSTVFTSPADAPDETGQSVSDAARQPASDWIPRRLNPSQRGRLVEALIDAFDHGGMGELASIGLGIPLGEIISPEKRLDEIGLALVEWAEAQGRLPELVAAAKERNPGNLLLQRWLQGSPGRRDSPYRGLFAFREIDADVFFGRDAFADRLAEGVEQRSLVAVIGPSGSGKSSVVFAGLLPRLRVAGGWVTASFRPGADPYAALAAALMPLLEPELSVTSQLAERSRLSAALREGEIKLGDVLNSIREKQDAAPKLLLIADQFEELFTLTRDDAVRGAFLDMLLSAFPPVAESPGTPPTLVLMPTMRADYLGQALTYPSLVGALQGADVKLGPMSREELRQAIERPAAQRGVALEEGLSERILDDVGEQPGYLPLLEFALTRLWEGQENGLLTHAAYEEAGEVEGALAKHADDVIAGFGGDLQRVRQVFTQLVRPGEGTTDTRRKANRAELGTDVSDLVRQLADAKLLVTDRDEETGADTVEVAHEALIRHWPTLRGWMDQDRDFRRWQERLRGDLREWEKVQRNPGALLQGVPLAVAEEWKQKRESELTEAERNFISVSVATRDEARATAKSRRQRNVRLLTLGLIGALMLAAFAGWKWMDAEAAWDQTEEQTRIGLSRQLAGFAQDRIDDQLDLALLLSVESVEAVQKNNTTSEARDSLLSALAASPYLSTILAEHGEPATSVEVDSAGHFLAAGGADGTVTLWDLASNHLLKDRLGEAGSGVRSLAFSPGEQLLAVGKQDGSVILWEMDDDSPPHDRPPLAGHTDAVTSLAFSPDGETLASGGADAKTILWDVPTGNQRSLLDGHTNAVMSMAFYRDGKTLVTAGADGTARLWNLDSGQQRGEPLERRSDTLLSVAISPTSDAPLIAIGGGDGSIVLWRPASGDWRALPPGHATAVTSLEFSARGETLASSSADQIIIWEVKDSQNPKLLQRIQGHDEQLTAIAFVPDGRSVVSAAFDGAVMRWDIERPYGFRTELERDVSTATSVAFSPDGTTVAIAREDANSIDLSSVDDPASIRSLDGHQKPPRSLAFAPDGEAMASAGPDQTVIFWDIASGQPRCSCTGHAAAITKVAYSADSQMLASGDVGGGIFLWDLASEGCPGTLVVDHRAEITSLAISPNRDRLATGYRDGAIVLRDITTGGTSEQRASQLSKEESAITSLAFAPDGQTLVVGSLGGAVIAWDLRDTRQQREPLGEHNLQVTSLAISSDSRVLASASADDTVIIWSLPTRQQIVPPLSAGLSGVETVAFGQAGQVLFSQGPGGIVTWDFDLDSWVKLACARANRNFLNEEWDRYFPNVPNEKRTETCQL
jgi:WD40 repeat protein